MSTELQGTPRRERLVRAAETLFARKGFHAASVPSIAAAAGVSAGLLYRYFPSKAALAVAIVEADREATSAAIAELTASGADPWEALTTLLRGWVAVAIQDRAACALVPEIAAEATRDPRIREVVLGAEESTVASVAGVVQRACPALDSPATAVALLAALDGLVARVAVDPAFDPWPSVEALVAMLTPHREAPR